MMGVWASDLSSKNGRHIDGVEGDQDGNAVSNKWACNFENIGD